MLYESSEPFEGMPPLRGIPGSAPQEALPTLVLSVGELQTINHLIKSYTIYWSRKPAPGRMKQGQYLQTIKVLHGRINTALECRKQMEQNRMLLSLADLEVLDEVVRWFTTLLPRVVAKSAERDEVISSLLRLKKHIEGMIQAAG
jgi:hypothetical protein